MQNKLFFWCFEPLGRIKEIQIEKEEDESDKGTRYMKLEMKREIPTLIKVPGQNDKLLVTVKGRASTCLICGRPGARDTPGVTPNVRRQNKPATEHTVYSRHPQARWQRAKHYAHTNGPRQSRQPAPRTKDPTDRPEEITPDLRPSQPRRSAPTHPYHDNLPGWPHYTPPRRAINAAPEGICGLKDSLTSTMWWQTAPRKRSKETHHRLDDDATMTDDDDTMWK